MAFKTCVDCTEFNADHGMYGHPVFESEQAWKEHRYKSHGGPKPVEPEAKAKQPAPEAPAAPQHDGPDVTRNDFSNFLHAVDDRFNVLESRVAALEGDKTGLLDRVAALEKPTA